MFTCNSLIEMAVWRVQKWHIMHSCQIYIYIYFFAHVLSSSCPEDVYLSLSLLSSLTLCIINKFSAAGQFSLEATISGKWRNVHHYAFTSMRWACAERGTENNQFTLFTWDKFYFDRFMKRFKLFSTGNISKVSWWENNEGWFFLHCTSISIWSVDVSFL